MSQRAFESEQHTTDTFHPSTLNSDKKSLLLQTAVLRECVVKALWHTVTHMQYPVFFCLWKKNPMDTQLYVFTILIKHSLKG